MPKPSFWFRYPFPQKIGESVVVNLTKGIDIHGWTSNQYRRARNHGFNVTLQRVGRWKFRITAISKENVKFGPKSYNPASAARKPKLIFNG